MRFLFLIFIVMPIIEVAVLIQIGQVIGVWWTVALVVTTAFIGVNMLRVQGLATLTRANWRMQSGQIPAQEMMEGVFLAIGGALLLTPGVITDVFGFLCLIPVTRIWMVKAMQVRFISAVSTSASAHAAKNANSTIIEGEVIDDEMQQDVEQPSNTDDTNQQK